MNVMHAVPEDARQVAEIHVRTWRAAFASILPDEFLANLSVERSEAMWSQCIASGTPQLLVAKVGDVMSGWLSFGASRDSDASTGVAEIWAFYVDPDAWSTGAGLALWLAARRLMREQKYRACSLWVISQNARAIRFYEKAGFVVDASMVKRSEFASRIVEQVRYVTDLGADGT